MTRGSFSIRSGFLIAGLILLAGAHGIAVAEPSSAATGSFNAYVSRVEARLGEQHSKRVEFLALPASGSDAATQLGRGELLIEKLTPASGPELSGAMLHHWRGTAFAPGATAADFERLMRDIDSYPRHFSPQVIEARVVGGAGDHLQARMRVRQRHVITVVLDTDYDIAFARLDAQHRFSVSRSSRIAEIENAGTSSERAMNATEDHGFLWRLNTYWSCEERDGGLSIQIESVSLTRSIPRGMAWAVGPFVESVPRESLEFTLRSVLNALRK
jgi:hypothetical protein